MVSVTGELVYFFGFVGIRYQLQLPNSVIVELNI